MSRFVTHTKSLVLALIGALHALYEQARRRPLEAEAVFVALLLFIAFLQPSAPPPPWTDGRIILADDSLSVESLENTFANLQYSLDDVRKGEKAVPRVLISGMPSGLKDIRVVDRRKRLFFRTVLPLILLVNEDIASNRERLKVIAAALESNASDEDTLDMKSVAWTQALAEQYGIDPLEDDVTLREIVEVLTVRVAPIPTSLALAQAVEESAWGTSRFARTGNALFGQWVWNENEGIVPTEQREGQAYAVRAFDSPLESVRAYAKNLNTHWAYTNFRKRRAELLAKGEPLNGWLLAETLTRYSERGEAYVESLRAIMRVNKLRPLDNAVLAPPDAMEQLASTISAEAPPQ